MAGKVQEANEFLRRPLYLFDLPKELLFSLLSQDVTRSSLEVESSSQTPDERPPPIKDEHGPVQTTSCALCKASFPSINEQREHVKSDFHRYNLKLKLKALPTVDETVFNGLIGELNESLSGSESADSATDEDELNEKMPDSTLTALLKRQARISHPDGDKELNPKKKKGVSGNPPLLWLSSSKLPENTSLGVYRALFTETERENNLVDVIKHKQLKPLQAKHSGSANQANPHSHIAETPHYFLCMIGGGHFAAMIVSLAPEIRKGLGGQEEWHAIIKAHKTFHRYTTRRKQGGSQSSNDNAKGNAHSAGSSIRRYNEMALEADVRGLLFEWREMIDQSELLFVRATGSTSRKTLYGPYDGQILRANDARIRGFPFSTRRATQSELLRAFTELTMLKVSSISQAALEAATTDQELVTKPSKPKTSSSDSTPKPSKEEEAALLHTSQIETLIRRSKAPALLTYLTKNDLSPNFSFFPADNAQHHHAPNSLHLASSNNSPALVLALLVKAKADPTLSNQDGKTAFDIAGDGKTRDAFRVARHKLGESAADWRAAHVPSALSVQEAVGRQQREKDEESTAEAERRKADLQRIRQEEEAQKVGKIEARAGLGQGLGSRDKTGADIREQEGRGLTPEIRLRLERERRARAAEERIKQIQRNR